MSDNLKQKFELFEKVSAQYRKTSDIFVLLLMLVLFVQLGVMGYILTNIDQDLVKDRLITRSIEIMPTLRTQMSATLGEVIPVYRAEFQKKVNDRMPEFEQAVEHESYLFVKSFKDEILPQVSEKVDVLSDRTIAVVLEQFPELQDVAGTKNLLANLKYSLAIAINDLVIKKLSNANKSLKAITEKLQAMRQDDIEVDANIELKLLAVTFQVAGKRIEEEISMLGK